MHTNSAEISTEANLFSALCYWLLGSNYRAGDIDLYGGDIKRQYKIPHTSLSKVGGKMDFVRWVSGSVKIVWELKSYDSGDWAASNRTQLIEALNAIGSASIGIYTDCSRAEFFQKFEDQTPEIPFLTIQSFKRVASGEESLSKLAIEFLDCLSSRPFDERRLLDLASVLFEEEARNSVRPKPRVRSVDEKRGYIPQHKYDRVHRLIDKPKYRFSKGRGRHAAYDRGYLTGRLCIQTGDKQMFTVALRFLNQDMDFSYHTEYFMAGFENGKFDERRAMSKTGASRHDQ